MSSILVKNMETPYCCIVCPFKEMYHDGLLCKATNPHKYIPKFLHKRYEKCPLVEVPTPHGDLIDRDDVIEEINRVFPCHSDEYEWAYTTVEQADTIIEAEKCDG